MIGNDHVRFGPEAAGKGPAHRAGTSPAAYRNGGSRSPAWARTRPPVPTSCGAPLKACRRRRSSAASSVTSPARSTPTSARPPANNPKLRGRPGPLIGCRIHAGPRAIRRPPPDPLELAGRDLIRACPPHPERPLPVLSATQQPGRSILPFQTLQIKVTSHATRHRRDRHRLVHLPRTAPWTGLAHPAAARQPKRHHHHRPFPHQRRAPRPEDHRPPRRTGHP